MESVFPYQIDHLKTIAQIDALEEEWANLIARIPEAPIFLTWEWIRTWWLHFGKDRELWLLTARDRQGRLVGIAPFMRELTGAAWMNLRKLAFIGTGSVQPAHLNILACESDQLDLCKAFLGLLSGQSDRWDVLSFASLGQNPTVSSVLEAEGGRARIGPQPPLPYVPLPAEWDTYFKTLNKKLRRNLRYFRTKLENDCSGKKVEFTSITDPIELGQAMEKLAEFSRHRWHARKIFTPFDDPIYCRFHDDIARLTLSRGWLRLYALKVADCIIAIFYCFCFHNRIYAYQIAFDLDWSAYSPGRLLIEHALRASVQEAATELDWGPGDDEYKLAWTDQQRAEHEILLSANWRGKLWVEWENFQGGLKIRAKQWLPETAQARIKQLLSGGGVSVKTGNLHSSPASDSS